MIKPGAEDYLARQAAIIESYRKVMIDRDAAREAEARKEALANLRAMGMSEGDAIRALYPEPKGSRFRR